MYTAYSVVVSSYTLHHTYAIVPCPVQLPPPFSFDLAFLPPYWSFFVSKLSSHLIPFSPIMSELLMFQLNLLNWLKHELNKPPPFRRVRRSLLTNCNPSMSIDRDLDPGGKKLGSADLRWRVRLIFHAPCKIKFEVRGSQ
jgi:hypothetical protein